MEDLKYDSISFFLKHGRISDDDPSIGQGKSAVDVMRRRCMDYQLEDDGRLLYLQVCMYALG